mmetsp:Transcript_12663/g.35624  ORF Transcript_12663/g.35624 Transcript_12663/m.35624 type:complete len:534 (+) Transcript_12663:714-2315(+)
MISGHDHNYERTFPVQEGKRTSRQTGEGDEPYVAHHPFSTNAERVDTVHLVVGTGGRYLRRCGRPKEYSNGGCIREHGYGVIEATRSVLKWAFKDTDGRIRDSFRICSLPGCAQLPPVAPNLRLESDSSSSSNQEGVQESSASGQKGGKDALGKPPIQATKEGPGPSQAPATPAHDMQSAWKKRPPPPPKWAGQPRKLGAPTSTPQPASAAGSGPNAKPTPPSPKKWQAAAWKWVKPPEASKPTPPPSWQSWSATPNNTQPKSAPQPGNPAGKGSTPPSSAPTSVNTGNDNAGPDPTPATRNTLDQGVAAAAVVGSGDRKAAGPPVPSMPAPDAGAAPQGGGIGLDAPAGSLRGAAEIAGPSAPSTGKDVLRIVQQALAASSTYSLQSIFGFSSPARGDGEQGAAPGGGRPADGAVAASGAAPPLPLSLPQAEQYGLGVANQELRQAVAASTQATQQQLQSILASAAPKGQAAAVAGGGGEGSLLPEACASCSLEIETVCLPGGVAVAPNMCVAAECLEGQLDRADLDKRFCP